MSKQLINQESTKVCSKCKEEKPLGEFYKHKCKKNGLHSECKICCNQSNKQHRFKHKDEINLRYKKYQLENIINTKNCCNCKIKKGIAEFSKDKSTKDGLRHKCKKCQKEHRDRNKEKLFQENIKYQLENQMSEKVCSLCGVKKNIAEFNKNKISKDGFKPQCRTCTKQHNIDHKDEISLKGKQYYLKNKEKIITRVKKYTSEHINDKKIYSKQWYLEHKEEEKLKHKRYYKKYYLEHKEEILLKSKQHHLKNKEKISIKNKTHYLKDKEKISMGCKKRYSEFSSERKTEIFLRQNKNRKQKYKTDMYFRTSCLCRSMVTTVLNGKPKNAHTMQYFMCSHKEFMDYIESLWLPGMTWNNRGNGTGKWNIDHIIPVSFFNVSDEVEKYMCCRWQNLQPLWWEDNMKKSDEVVLNT